MELNTNKIFGNIFLILFILCLCLQFSFLDNITKFAKNTTESTVTRPESATVPTILSSGSISTTTCKLNTSCFVNTTIQNVTTTSIPKTTEENNATSISGVTEAPTIPTKLSNFESKQIHNRSGKGICICDLKVEYCDINCCCDKDCSLEDKLVFGHCENDFHHYDARFCQYTKHIYINKSLHELKVNQDGLFCMIANNVPSSYLIQRKHPLKTFEEAEYQKVNKYSWPRHLEETPRFNYMNYTYGKPLWIIQNNSLKKFQFLKGFVVPNCLTKEDVKYLVDVKSTCSHTDVSENNHLLDIAAYFVNNEIIGSPGLLHSSINKNNFTANCPKNVCLVTGAKICNKYFENCTKIDKNSTNHLKPRCHLSITKNELSCVNLVQYIKYKLYHNGTAGLTRAELFFNLANVSYNLNKNYEFPQTFEVNFTWWNHTLNYSSYFSGNPGYLVGKPILTANIISINTTTNNTTNSSISNSTYGHELKIYRNPFDFTSSFVVLPYVNTEGQCILNKHEYTPIEFDYNLYLKCTIDEILQRTNRSAGSICTEVQKTIFKYWSLNLTNNTLDNKLIGQFGNANLENADDWIKVMYGDDLQNITNRTWGKFEHNMNSLVCGNITTLLIIEVYYTRVDFEDVVNQNKILATTLQFNQFRNLTFLLNPKDSHLKLSTKIGAQISFFDITTRKMRKFVDPPSLNIRLPHDFFYPFVKLNNKATNIFMCIYLVFFHVVFVNILK